jgi:DNA-binding winged helix-turn-helix (wHTH) protein/tetratricopeptide (TPR) repeat protein
MRTGALPEGFGVGDWHVYPAQGRLSRNGRIVEVRPKVMDLLVFLAQAPGQVISKDTLLDEVWGTQTVSESALTRTVTELRQALSDDAERPQILETIPKRGYRLIAPVTFVAPASVTEDMPSVRRNRPFAVILGALTLLVIAAVLVSGGALGNGAGDRKGRDNRLAVDFAARDWVLIAPFENRTGEATFDEVVEHALEGELLNSGFVNVVPRARVEDVLALMKKPTDTRLGDALAREVALRDGAIRVLLTGRIDRVGSEYVLNTRIVDPVDGRAVAAVSHHVENHNEFIAGIRRQALDVRALLGETIASIERSRNVLASVTTPSLQALQLYSRAAALLGGEAWRFHPDAGSRYASAEALLTQATSLDASFASAWLLRAHAVCQQSRAAGEYLPLADRAVQLSRGVSAVERYFIEGFTQARLAQQSEDPRQYDAAARAFEAVLQIVPDHYWTLLELVPVYQQLDRFHDAERVVIHSAAVRPRSVRFAVNAARAHVRNGEWASARALIDRARLIAKEDANNMAAVPVDSLEWLQLWEAHEAWLARDPARALAAIRRMDEESANNKSVPWAFKLASVYSGLGRFEEALRVTDRLPDDRREWLRTGYALQRGERTKVQQLVTAHRRDFDYLNNHFMRLVRGHWFEQAEWVMAERQRRGFRLPSELLADHVGQLRVEQGRFAEGLALLVRIKPDPMSPKYNVLEHIAKARRGLGDLGTAIRELEAAGDTRAQAVTHDGWQVVSWLQCRVLLAELYRDAGRDADAQRVAQEVQVLLGVADADHPLLARVSKLIPPVRVTLNSPDTR